MDNWPATRKGITKEGTTKQRKGTDLLQRPSYKCHWDVQGNTLLQSQRKWWQSCTVEMNRWTNGCILPGQLAHKSITEWCDSLPIPWLCAPVHTTFVRSAKGYMHGLVEKWWCVWSLRGEEQWWGVANRQDVEAMHVAGITDTAVQYDRENVRRGAKVRTDLETEKRLVISFIKWAALQCEMSK